MAWLKFQLQRTKIAKQVPVVLGMGQVLVLGEGIGVGGGAGAGTENVSTVRMTVWIATNWIEMHVRRVECGRETPSKGGPSSLLFFLLLFIVKLKEGPGVVDV